MIDQGANALIRTENRNGTIFYLHSELVLVGVSAPLLLLGAEQINGSILERRKGVIAITPGIGVTGAKVQLTLFSHTTIQTAPAAVLWHDWDLGSVTLQTIQEFEAPVTALRLVTTGGSSNWEVAY